MGEHNLLRLQKSACIYLKWNKAYYPYTILIKLRWNFLIIYLKLRWKNLITCLKWTKRLHKNIWVSWGLILMVGWPNDAQTPSWLRLWTEQYSEYYLTIWLKAVINIPSPNIFLNLEWLSSKYMLPDCALRSFWLYGSVGNLFDLWIEGSRLQAVQ